MKLFIASDIHGSLTYCRKMIDAAASEGADKLLLLGDILYHGPRNDLPDGYDPKSVAALLNDHKTSILCIRGNCDSEVDQMMLDFPILSESMLLLIDGHTVYATHGHHYGIKNPPPLNDGEVFLQGHTHVPGITVCRGNITGINPGSVSIPKGGSECGYAVYENGRFTVKNFSGGGVCQYSFQN